MQKGIKYLLWAVLIFLAGAWISYQLSHASSREDVNVEASVLLKRIREVCQLVTVEGEFSEIYRETNLRDVTLYLPIPTHWTFSKKALLRVDGKVLVGYDMEQVSIKIDSFEQKITMTNLPRPTILAIDHSIKYLDLEESFFNEFTPEDYTQLNINAKAMLRKKAYESDLIEQAKKQGLYLLDAIDFMAKGIGWELIYKLPSDELPNATIAY